MIKVSIIIPVYNVEFYIKDCISSIMAQNYDFIEVIIVDDCTPDQSIEIASKLISNYNGPHTYKIIKHKRNQGVAASRNTGIKEATGELIFFLDSDDYLPSDSINTLIHLYNQTHTDIVIGNQKRIDHLSNKVIGQPTKIKNHNKTFHTIKDLLNDSEFVKMDCNGVVWNKLLRKEFLLENKLYFDEGILFEDDIWMYKTYCHNPTVTVCDHISYIYRMRPSSIMSTFTELHFYSSIACADIAINYCKQFTKSQTEWFAIWGVEKYILGALYKALDKIKTQDAYKILYKRFRKIYTPSTKLWFNFNIPIIIKIKSLHHLLPQMWGEKYLLVLLKHQQKIMHKRYPIQAAIPPIKLNKTFWTKL